jgi:uncharacterized protein (DUF362 family)
MSLVSLTKIENSNMKQAIENSLNLINYNFDSKVRNIVIKPNLCYYWDHSTGQTTDPKFVASLIDLIREKISPDVDITLVESDASAMKCKYAFKFLRYEELARNSNVRLINLSEDKTDPIELTCGGKSFQFLVPRVIRKADLRINLPKIKYTMEEIKITCALKNIYGCNPYPKKYKYHSELGKTIVAINKAMPFDLCIIDGNIVSGVRPQILGLVMASKDPVAIDAAAAKIAGVNPKTMEYLKIAAQEGLGHMSFVEKGIPLAHFKARYPKKGFQKKLMGQAYKMVVKMKLGKRLGLA